MTPRRTHFYLDKQNGKFLGVCAGIADYTGIDVLLVRIATLLLFFTTGFGVVVYFAAAWPTSRPTSPARTAGWPTKSKPCAERS